MRWKTTNFYLKLMKRSTLSVAFFVFRGASNCKQLAVFTPKINFSKYFFYFFFNLGASSLQLRFKNININQLGVQVKVQVSLHFVYT